MIRNLIWKRCLLRDDWEVFKKTSERSDRELEEELMQTSAFETIKLGIKEDLFDSENSPNIPSPESLLGAGSSTDDYTNRFPSDDLRVPISTDNAADDELLKRLLETSNLSDLFSQVKTLAMEAAMEEGNQQSQKADRLARFQHQWMNGTDHASFDDEGEPVIKEEEEEDAVFGGEFGDQDEMETEE